MIRAIFRSPLRPLLESLLEVTQEAVRLAGRRFLGVSHLESRVTVLERRAYGAERKWA